MAASALDRPLEPDESIEHACAHRFRICAQRAHPLFDTRSCCFLAVLAKNTVPGLNRWVLRSKKVVPELRTDSMLIGECVGCCKVCTPASPGRPTKDVHRGA